MDPRLKDIVASTFELQENEGESKVVSLPDAIRQHVKPGMTLCIPRDASAAELEILRQFNGTTPDFTLIQSVAVCYALNLVHAGLVTRLITSNASHLYPSPGPIPIIQKAHKDKKLQIENWSLKSLQERLMAGAFGLPFVTTKSIRGSTMAEENASSFGLVDDPFNPGKKQGVVRALNPDVAIVQAVAADRYGNAIPSAWHEENLWGPKAARHGVVVAAERIVPTSFIRRHSQLVKIPGYLVKAVCQVPFGAHPLGMISPGIEGMKGYAADYERMLAHRAACDKGGLDAWNREWAFDCKDHESYLSKVGGKTLLELVSRTTPEGWRYELEALQGGISWSREFNEIETMVAICGRKVKEKALKNGYRTVLAGVGTSGFAAWVAYYSLLKEGYGLDVLIGSGPYGLTPRPGDSSLLNLANLLTCKMITDNVEQYGVIVGGENNKCIALLSSAQIDRFGNINTTKIGDSFLIGTGGANDAINSRESLVISQQGLRRLVEKVDYISCPGDRVKTLVTNRAIFEKLGDDGELSLTALMPNPKLSREQKIKEIKETCGWQIKMAPQVVELESPTYDEVMMIRTMDPQSFVIGV